MYALHWRERWQLFRFEADRRSFLFGIMAFALNLGFGCGMGAANALLVGRVGTEPLFYVYIGSSVLTFLLAGATLLWADRQSRSRAFWFSFEAFAACILALWYFVNHHPHAFWPIFFARILSDVFFVLALLQFWLLAGDHFTNLEARLRFPLLVAANGLGYMIGGLLLDAFAAKFQALNFFLIWAGILALLPLLLRFLPGGESSAPRRFEAGSVASAPRSAARLVRALFFFWVAFTFFTYGVDYFFNSVALGALSNENQLAAFFGKVAFFSLAVVFVFQIFLAGPLARALRVDRSLLIICAGLFIGTALVIWHPSLAGVAVAEGLIFYFMDAKAVALLQPVGNLFPDRMRGRVKVLLDGFAPSTGDVLLLLVSLALFATVGIDSLAYILAGGTLLFLAFPWWFRGAYSNYLTDCLHAEDPKLVLNAVQALGERGNKAASLALLGLLEASDELQLKRNIILALGDIRNDAALPQVIAQFSSHHESLQLAVVESLARFRNYPSLFALYELMKSQDNVSFQVRMSATLLMSQWLGRRMLPLLQEALREDDPRIQANAIESLANIRSAEIIPAVRPFLASEHRRLRANAAIALYPFRSERAAAKAAVVKLFESEDSLTRFSGIFAIGELRLREFEKALIAFLDHPDSRHRHQVLSALAKMGNRAYTMRFADLLAGEDTGLALESIRNLARFPASSRWLVFECISKMDPIAQSQILERLDQTPFDFSQERRLLTNQRELFYMQGR